MVMAGGYARVCVHTFILTYLELAVDGFNYDSSSIVREEGIVRRRRPAT